MSGMEGDYECWAWVTLVDDRECFVGALMHLGGIGPAHMALVHRNRALVEGPYAEIARSHAESSGQPVRLVHLREVSE